MKKIKLTRRQGRILKVLIALGICVVCYISVSLWWNSKYDKENYNCVGMSYDVAKAFHSLGIPVKVVYGDPKNPNNLNHTVGHCWLVLFGCIEFESTCLTIHPFNDNAKHYSENKWEVLEPWSTNYTISST